MSDVYTENDDFDDFSAKQYALVRPEEKAIRVAPPKVKKSKVVKKRPAPVVIPP